jgi:hypothetical protein
MLHIKTLHFPILPNITEHYVQSVRSAEIELSSTASSSTHSIHLPGKIAMFG